jgi:predicted DNA-binding protein
MSTVNISAHISPELSKMLDVVSKMEERSKSYYIQKGLKMILERKLEDIEDLKEIEDYEKIKGLNPTVSWNDLQKLIK